MDIPRSFTIRESRYRREYLGWGVFVLMNR